MEQNQYIVALEIGSSKIVGAIAEKSASGLISVNHLAEERLSNCVRYGCVQNVENIKSSINRIIHELERSIDGRVTQVFVGISGRSLHSEMTEENRGLDSQKSITQETITSIIREAARKQVKSYETIDIVPCAYYVDKTETTEPVGQFGSSIKIKANLIVAKPQLKLNLDRVMSFGIKARDYIVTPLAVGREVLKDSEISLGVMLVDIGAETTTVSIYKGGALTYLMTLPMGGRNITRDIMNGANVLEETAEQVKKNINNPLDPNNVDIIDIEGVKSSDASNYIAARVGEIIANIKQQIEYAGMNDDDIRTVVLIGGTVAMPGLPQKVEEILKIKVRLGQYPQTLNITNHAINKPEYIQVFSLLARGADMMPRGETCVERHSYESPMVPPQAPEAPVVPPQPEPSKPHKRSFIEKLRDKAKEFFTEDEETDE